LIATTVDIGDKLTTVEAPRRTTL